jgi:hypothetical protein
MLALVGYRDDDTRFSIYEPEGPIEEKGSGADSDGG